MSSKRKVESLDDIESNKKEKIQEHIYFEPKFCSDLVLTYNNTHFHVHKYIMATESMYFLNLLTTITKEEEEPIVLPEVKEFNGSRVSVITYHQFINLLYRYEKPESCDFTYEFGIVATDIEISKLNYYIIAALSHYFNCLRMEKILEDISIGHCEKYRVDTINIKQLFEDFNLIMTYHWERASSAFLIFIGQNLKKIRKAEDYKSSYWLSLKSETRELILEQSVRHVGSDSD